MVNEKEKDLLELNQKIVDLLKERFEEDGGAEHYERAHEYASILLEAGLLQAAKNAYHQLLAVDPEDEVALEALEDIEQSLQ
ncbi:MAG: hypothetical protein COX62_03895 [Deltaproteobacteria bacterium CG_4_10_14_0_2_um_filter_43_8]|nr:MAG: hypothetical protein COV43_00965 [Deltaproteobacteria bacterium CG11_big_fil_rev_8_21_14_0_20_42_23]PJA20855.1 MAG: hypothetical protein COX62_03895 [Deltaproteobacteria bacterium CG_4_10_14_0_2_um_filter_43_8]PJC63574.1 MAG: hypothetical protein CO021_09025 [Deltaproteobacteria bacterium CG_4_9_14_0_2_um_filter_42_21]